MPDCGGEEDPLRVLFGLCGDIAFISSRMRAFQFFDCLERNGVRCDTYVRGEGRTRFQRWLGFFRKAYASDVIFVQRLLLSPLMVWLLRLFGKKFILDFDDAIYLRGANDPTPIDRRLYRRLRYLLKSSECVIVANEYLREFASPFNANTHVVPVVIDTDICRPPEVRTVTPPVVIGWTGSADNFVYLKKLEPVLIRLKEIYSDRIDLLVISTELPDLKVDVRLKKWSLASECQDLALIHVGLMPLEESPWALGKSPTKTLQYMALGIPMVCSPVGVNKSVIRDGENGFIASSEDEWVEKLSLLVENDGLRAKIATSARKTVEETLSLKVHAPRILQILRETALS
jgi:glycosyltransferase involved in cell wall biosynthesis